MRIAILGGDGYLGWPCALYFVERGHEIAIVDNFARRKMDRELGTESLTPIESFGERIAVSGKEFLVRSFDLSRNYDPLAHLFADFEPEAVIHFAEQRSAPYSMIGRRHALYTQRNNVLGTLNVLYAMKEICPEAHLIKLGTMGEYGTPNIDIEEGFIEIEHKGRRDVLPFPKQAGSWYHQTKVHDSNNIMFACKMWGIKATDLNQGVVYGVETEETKLAPPLATRFDYDHVFGTVLNRFCVQAACDLPLTVYGKGGQTRGYLDIRDTMRCIELAMQNPPGEPVNQSASEPVNPSSRTPAHSRTGTPIPTFVVFNQITEVFSVNALARLVEQAARTLFDLDVKIVHIENPRIEAERHYYQPKFDRFKVLGLQARKLAATIPHLIELALKHKDRVRKETIMPGVTWR